MSGSVIKLSTSAIHNSMGIYPYANGSNLEECFVISKGCRYS